MRKSKRLLVESFPSVEYEYIKKINLVKRFCKIYGYVQNKEEVLGGNDIKISAGGILMVEIVGNDQNPYDHKESDAKSLKFNVSINQQQAKEDKVNSQSFDIFPSAQ